MQGFPPPPTSATSFLLRNKPKSCKWHFQRSLSRKTLLRGGVLLVEMTHIPRFLQCDEVFMSKQAHHQGTFQILERAEP